jgi:hypothetical protein
MNDVVQLDTSAAAENAAALHTGEYDFRNSNDSSICPKLTAVTPTTRRRRRAAAFVKCPKLDWATPQ